MILNAFYFPRIVVQIETQAMGATYHNCLPSIPNEVPTKSAKKRKIWYKNHEQYYFVLCVVDTTIKLEMLIKSMDVLIGFIFFTFWTLVVSTLHKTFLFFWTKWNDRLLKTGRDWWLGIASPRYLLRRVSSNQSHYTKAKRTLGNSPVNYLGLYVVSSYKHYTVR